MSMVSLGDLAQSFMLRRQSTVLKADVTRLSSELTTGRAVDTARQVSGDFTALAGVDASLGRLAGYRASTTEAALQTGVMQTVLETVEQMATRLGASLLLAGTSGQQSQVAAVGSQALQSFETAVSAFNTRLGNRSLFSGAATDQPALIAASDMLTAIEAATAGAVTATEVKTAVDAWFQDPAGYASLAYTGGQATGPLAIAPEETARIGITAADPAIRDTLAGLAMAALLDRGILAGQTQARADLAHLSGSHLVATQTARVDAAARLGVVEGQIAAATSRNAAETSALQIARADIVSVDQYEASARLEAAASQLETLYALTARISRLSLVDFLR